VNPGGLPVAAVIGVLRRHNVVVGNGNPDEITVSREDADICETIKIGKDGIVSRRMIGHFAQIFDIDVNEFYTAIN
jgi:hypothetical protein